MQYHETYFIEVNGIGMLFLPKLVKGQFIVYLQMYVNQIFIDSICNDWFIKKKYLFLNTKLFPDNLQAELKILQYIGIISFRFMLITDDNVGSYQKLVKNFQTQMQVWGLPENQDSKLLTVLLCILRVPGSLLLYILRVPGYFCVY